METINSVAALKRLAPGTILRKVRTIDGPCDELKALVGFIGGRMSLRVNVGYSLSYVNLTGVKVEAAPNGFKLLVKENGTLLAEYQFVNEE